MQAGKSARRADDRARDLDVQLGVVGPSEVERQGAGDAVERAGEDLDVVEARAAVGVSDQRAMNRRGTDEGSRVLDLWRWGSIVALSPADRKLSNRNPCRRSCRLPEPAVRPKHYAPRTAIAATSTTTTRQPKSQLLPHRESSSSDGTHLTDSGAALAPSTAIPTSWDILGAIARAYALARGHARAGVAAASDSSGSASRLSTAIRSARGDRRSSGASVGFDRWCWPLADPETLLPLSGIAEHDYGPGVLAYWSWSTRATISRRSTSSPAAHTRLEA